MSSRPWLEALKGTVKENVPNIVVLRKNFWKSHHARVRKVRKPLSISFCTFCTPATLGIQKNCARGRDTLYER